MADDIRALSAQLAQDPQSLVFLRLGEALRRKGQLEAALRVALNGLERHPHLADAHDLYAKFGFVPLAAPGRFMELHVPNVYSITPL